MLLALNATDLRFCHCFDLVCPRFVQFCPVLSLFVLSGSFEISEFWDKKGHFDFEGKAGRSSGKDSES